MFVEIEKLSAVLMAKEEEISQMTSKIDEQELNLRHRDIRLMRIAQLETAIQSNKIQHQFDLQKLQARHVKTLKEFEKEIARFSKTEAENQAFRETLGVAEKKMKSFQVQRRLLFEYYYLCSFGFEKLCAIILH